MNRTEQGYNMRKECLPLPARDRAASVLILALWALFFLAALAISVGAHVSSSLRLSEAMMKRVRAYHLAKAGVARAAYLIASNTNSWDGLSEDAWNNDDTLFKNNTELDGGSFSVFYVQREREGEGEELHQYGVIGEERCINILRGITDRGLLSPLLRYVGGTSAAKADEIADAIIEWATPKDRQLTRKTESDYYRGLEVPYGTHGGSFQSVYELLLIKGIDDELFERIRPFVTIHGSGKIDVNIAPREVLFCVAIFKGADRLQAEKVADEIVGVRPKKEVADFYEDLTEEGNRALRNMKGMLTVNSTCFSGTVVGRVGVFGAESVGADVAESRISFVLDADGREQYWHEH